MASCMECFHYEVCKPMGIAMRNAMELGVLTKGVEHNCYIKCFKPIADVVEVKHGEWKEIVEKGTCFEHTYYICSNCGVVALDEDYEIHCHHCGAKMDGERK